MISKYNTSCFVEDLKCLNIELREEQIAQFLEYYELLIEWNGFMNLTAITEYDGVMKKHFVDSLSLVRACDLSKKLSVIDVGTGAGFPGLALKIAFPNLQVTLLDSLNKRIKFLDAVIVKLGLSGITTFHGRAEDYAMKKQFRETYNLCVSRAVANMATLSEYCLPFVKLGGEFVSYKSEKITVEIEEASQAIEILGGKIDRNEEFQLPNSDIYRNLVVVKKVKGTPGKYPRKSGVPGKEPLK